MSLRPYIAAFLIAAVFNPFCCCFGKPFEQERSPIASCSHCPPPAEPSDEAPCDCVGAEEFTVSQPEFKIPATDPIALPGESWQTVTAALPDSGWITIVATAPALPPPPPIRVRFCTYLL